MNILESFILLLGIHLSINYTYLRITNCKKLCKHQIFILLIILIAFTLFQSFLQNFSSLYKILIICFSYTFILGKINHITFEKSFIAIFISISISLITSLLSVSIVLLFALLIKVYYTNIFLVVSTSILNILLVYLLFRIKRFKNGFPFLSKPNENVYLSILILIINAIIIFTYFIVAKYANINLFAGFALFTIILFIIIYKAFILLQKQKLQTKALKDYEQELSETKQKLSTAIEEKEKLVKSNHEFYHRQAALNKKLDDLIAHQKLLTNTEFGEDIGNLADRINNLSNEYIEKTKMLPKLTKTNIVEIDDMFSYLQSECDKNNIEFILKIECDVNYIIDNYISKRQLETLLGDLIRNAIIAVNHSQNKFRSIMTVLGIKDDNYEICVLDSGIDFEINTLINLGLTHASTHTDEGGTGIGYITTFETLKACNASFIINEITNNNYTKSLEIKFDNKHEYVIVSKRTEEINQLNSTNRTIILKG